MQREVQKELLSVIETLFNNSNFVADVYIDIPNADYKALICILTEHEDFFRSASLDWKITHKRLHGGYELRFGRTNRGVEKKVI